MIEIKSLNKYYGSGNAQVHAVRDASLTLPDRGIVAIFGKSGCGKTTLLNIIGGLDTASSGQVTIDSKRITPDSNEARNRHIGYIFQNYNLSKHLTVLENVALSLRLCGVSDEAAIEARALAALRSVDMEQYKNRLPDSLSGGQQQRVAIARALVKNPRLILADEPTGNLDEQNTLMVMDLLRQVAKDHLVLLVTHEADLVDYYCDFIVEVADGKIVSTRKNDVSAYAGKSNRDIYLGDLEHTEVAGDSVAIDYYGPARAQAAKIRLISVRGTLYLQADPDVKLRVLDDSAEIKVHRGKQEESERRVHELDPALRAPLPTTRRAGRLFGAKGAIVSGFRTNFSGQKKSKKLMISGLICFALVFVFLFSYFGHSLSVLDEIEAAYNADSILVKTEAFTDYSKLQNLLDRQAVDSVTRLESYYSETETSQLANWNFGIGNFESTKNRFDFSMTFQGSAVALDVAAAKDCTLLAGKKTLEGTQILISSGLADKLLKVAGVDFIEDYESLLYINGTRSFHSYYSEKATSYTIVGIVEDTNACVYLTPSALASYNLETAGHQRLVGVLPASLATLLRLAPLGENELYLCDSSMNVTTLKIGEKTYTVKANLQNAIGELQNTLINEAIAAKTPDFIDEYATEIESFIGKTKAQILSDIEAKDTDLTPHAVVTYVEEIYYAQVNDNPEDYTDPNHWEIFQNFLNPMRDRANEFTNELHNDFWNSQNDMWRILNEMPALLCREADLPALSQAILIATEDNTSDSMWAKLSSSGNYFGGMEASNGKWLSLHARDVEALRSALAFVSADSMVTPEQQYQAQKDGSQQALLISTVSMVALAALMALCLYFIMRSTLMASIKEIGTYRAIGVSRKNLIFKYLVETLVLFALTIFIGYAISSGVLWWLLGTVKMLSSFLYYPVWMGVMTFALLLTMSCVCGVLPIFSLLRKTPSEILSKYDI